MNPDYIIGGKGQPALFNPNWASSANARAETAETKVASADAHAMGRPRGDDRLGPEPFEADFSFDDFLDIINPLQHIPVVNLIYRELTGDKISGVAQIAGSTILGGPLGLISGVASVIVEEETGKGVGETIVAALTGGDGKSSPTATPDAGTTMLADAGSAAKKTVPTQMAAAGDEKEKVLLAAEENSTGNTGAPLENQEGVVPLAPPPTRMQDGQKFFSLAGVPRIGAVEPKMPVRDAPDVRLKPVERQGIGRSAPSAPPPSSNTLAGLNNSPQDVSKLLGLPAAEAETDIASVGGLPSPSPNAFHGRNPLPPQLIDDMMLMNLQKYQDGLKNAPARGSMVDVGG